MKIFWSLLLFAIKLSAAELYQPGIPTRCLAMGGTCISHMRGASALFFNPAALARVEGFDLILVETQAGVSKDAVDFSSQFQGTTFTASDLNKLYGKTLTADVTARSGFAMPNFGFGLYSNNYTTMQFSDPTFPTFRMNLVSDYGYIFGGSFSMGGESSIGISAKHIKRWGGEKDINLLSIVGASSDSVANSNFQDRGIGHSMDIAYMTSLNHHLKPTISVVWKDIGVTTFNLTSGVTPPPSQQDNLILGAAIKQEVGIMSFTHAFEYKFIRTTGYDFSKKVHLGTELAVGPVDLRAGINQGYVTYGAGVDLFFFQIDAAAYATELGDYVGQARSDRYNVSVTINLDFDQSFKLRDMDGKRRRLKQRR